MLWNYRGNVIMVSDIINGHDLPLMGEHHETKDSQIDCPYGVHITMAQKDVVVNGSINYFDINEDQLASKV